MCFKNTYWNTYCFTLYKIQCRFYFSFCFEYREKMWCTLLKDNKYYCIWEKFSLHLLAFFFKYYTRPCFKPPFFFYKLSNPTYQRQGHTHTQRRCVNQHISLSTWDQWVSKDGAWRDRKYVKFPGAHGDWEKTRGGEQTHLERAAGVHPGYCGLRGGSGQCLEVSLPVLQQRRG